MFIGAKINGQMKRFKASVIGGSGYGGAEIIRRLLIHPEVELVRVASIDYVGQPLGAAHPPLTGRTNLKFEKLGPQDAAAGCDIVLLGLPHKVSAEVGAALLPTGVKIVDMSGDFRLRDAAAYERFYGARHPHPDLLGRFVYGLPELNRAAIQKAQAVASPGCFATTIELALLPLVKAGLLGGVVQVVGITGSSGQRRGPQRGHPPPGAGQQPEELQDAGAPARAGDRADPGGRRGRPGEVPAALHPRLGAAEPGHPGHLLRRGARQRDQGQPGGPLPGRPTRASRSCASWAIARPRWRRCPGSNYAEVGFTLGPVAGATRTLAIQAATDNLIKGGAGQAVQNMNLMLGLPETLSLEDPGPWP